MNTQARIMVIRRPTIVSWLAQRFFYPLLAISLLAIALYAGWLQTTEEWTGPRLCFVSTDMAQTHIKVKRQFPRLLVAA